VIFVEMGIVQVIVERSRERSVSNAFRKLVGIGQANILCHLSRQRGPIVQIVYSREPSISYRKQQVVQHILHIVMSGLNQLYLD
jgi:hypothetical protein